MATRRDLQRILGKLPEISRGKYWDDEQAYFLAKKGFVMHRTPHRDVGTVDSRTDKPYTDLIVVQLGSFEEKEQVLAGYPEEVVFTIPHFRRSAAVLVRLSKISTAMLEDLLDEAWDFKAPPKVRAAHGR